MHEKVFESVPCVEIVLYELSKIVRGAYLALISAELETWVVLIL